MKVAIFLLLTTTAIAAESADVRTDRVLFFHASWCVPCHEALDGERGFRRWLTDAGWKISDSTSAHVQLVDVDRRADLVERYGVASVPAMVRVRNGKPSPVVQYTGRASLLPLLNVAKPVTPIVRFNRATHCHRCPVDGTTWCHTDASHGNPFDHACPTCGRLQWKAISR